MPDPSVINLQVPTPIPVGTNYGTGAAADGTFEDPQEVGQYGHVELGPEYTGARLFVVGTDTQNLSAECRVIWYRPGVPTNPAFRVAYAMEIGSGLVTLGNTNWVDGTYAYKVADGFGFV